MSTSRSELALYPVQGTRPTTSAKIVPNLFNPRSVHGGSGLRVTLQPLGKFTWLSRPIRPSVVWVTVTPMLAITRNKLLSLNGSFLLVNHCMLWGINTDLGEVVEVHRWEPSFRWGGCGERSIGKGLAYVRWLSSKSPDKSNLLSMPTPACQRWAGLGSAAAVTSPTLLHTTSSACLPSEQLGPISGCLGNS